MAFGSFHWAPFAWSRKGAAGVALFYQVEPEGAGITCCGAAGV